MEAEGFNNKVDNGDENTGILDIGTATKDTLGTILSKRKSPFKKLEGLFDSSQTPATLIRKYDLIANCGEENMDFSRLSNKFLLIEK